MKWLLRILKNVFSKPEQPKPIEIEVTPPIEKPIEQPTQPQQEQPVEQPKPIEQNPDIDNVNDGSGAKPDWSYIVDHCWLDDGVKPKVEAICNRILKGKFQYLEVEALTGVPWYAVAIWHLRECDLDFKGCLHNGDRCIGNGKKTWNVPKGRGPFNTWLDAAIDALTIEGFTKVKNWNVKLVVEASEKYNGLGYRKKIGDSGVIEYSPYITAGTNWSDETGKYVSDGKFDPKAKEAQLSVIAILIGLGVIKENKPV